MRRAHRQASRIGILYDGTAASVERIIETLGSRQGVYDCSAQAGYLMLPGGRILYIGEYFDVS